MKKKTLNSEKKHQLIINTVLTLALIVLLLPFYWCIVLSFDKTAITDIPAFSLVPHEFTLNNYAYAWESIDLPRYFLNTAFITVINTTLCVFFALICGYAFAKGKFAGKKVIYFLMLGVMMIPFESRMIPLYLQYKEWGMLNTYWPLILGSFAYVYGTFFARQNIAAIPDSLCESARIDGASEWKIFFKIILPLCKPVASALAILQVIAQWNSYLWPMIVIRSNSLQLLSVGIASLSADEYQVYYGPRMAVIVLSTLPLVIFYLFLQKYIVQSVALSGVKE